MRGASPTPDATETVFFNGPSRHTTAIGSYLQWGLLSVVGGALAWVLGAHAEVESGARWALLLLGLPGLAWTLAKVATTRFKVGSKRVEIERGVFSREVRSLELWRVLDVGYRQSFLDRLLGDGRIRLTSNDQSDPELELHGLPSSRALFESLRDAVQEARRTGRPLEMVGEEARELV